MPLLQQKLISLLRLRKIKNVLVDDWHDSLLRNEPVHLAILIAGTEQESANGARIRQAIHQRQHRSITRCTTQHSSEGNKSINTNCF